MRYRNSGVGSDGAPLAAPGQKPGAAVVRFPGHAIACVVEEGDEVVLPDDLPQRSVLSACPSLIPVEPSAAPVEAPAIEAAPAEKRKRAPKE